MELVAVCVGRVLVGGTDVGWRSAVDVTSDAGELGLPELRNDPRTAPSTIARISRMTRQSISQSNILGCRGRFPSSGALAPDLGRSVISAIESLEKRLLGISIRSSLPWRVCIERFGLYTLSHLGKAVKSSYFGATSTSSSLMCSS
jgi:hypothetical protein